MKSKTAKRISKGYCKQKLEDQLISETLIAPTCDPWHLCLEHLEGHHVDEHDPDRGVQHFRLVLHECDRRNALKCYAIGLCSTIGPWTDYKSSFSEMVLNV